ncbi:MAG: hypothetical protein JST09_03170 [Bacteroidetes bacterium]|nr:hypothetical protein [Bacteroidota bacterium]
MGTINFDHLNFYTMKHEGIEFLKKMFFVFNFTFLLSSVLVAQVFIETYPPVSNNTDMGVRISGMQNLSDRLSYEKITGSPFYNDEWQLASLTGMNEKEKWLCKVKINLATGELYYQDKQGHELVADDGLIRKIVLHKNDDTSAVVATFILTPEPVKLNQERRNSYMQVLNGGSYQLLKLNIRNLNSADSLFGTQKRYFFKDEEVYFIHHNEMLNNLRRLDKDNLLQFLPGSSVYIDWAKQNKINFRKEEDVIRFMNYYNSKK